MPDRATPACACSSIQATCTAPKGGTTGTRWPTWLHDLAWLELGFGLAQSITVMNPFSMMEATHSALCWLATWRTVGPAIRTAGKASSAARPAAIRAGPSR